MNKIHWKLFIMIVMCASIAVCGVSNSAKFEETKRNEPIAQATTSPPVIDSNGQSWNYAQGTPRYMEAGQTINISVNWGEIAQNANITSEEAIAPWTLTQQFIAPVYSTTDGSNYSNFSLTIPSSGNNMPDKRFRVSSFIPGSTEYITTLWSYYTCEEKTAPQITGTAIAATVVSIGQHYGIKLYYPLRFTDNVHIKYYEIARKSADDNIVISDANANFDENLLNSTAATEFIDYTLTHDSGLYYYAVRAVDDTGLKSGVKSIIQKLSTDIVPPPLLSYSAVVGSTTLENSPTIKAEGTLTVQIFTTAECVGGSVSFVDMAGLIPAYDFTLALLGGTTWKVDVNLALPRGTGSPMQPGTYKMIIILLDVIGNQNATTVNSFFTIETPPADTSPTGTEEKENNLYIYIGIGAGIAVAVVGLVIVKRKRDQANMSDADIEMTSGPGKKQRKGKIYKGASSIGKASGEEADALQRRRGAEPAKKTSSEVSSSPPKRVSAASAPAMAASTSVSSIKSNTIVSKKQASDNMDDLLGDSKPSVMQLKKAEGQVDLTRKMEFLTSKLIAIDQNIALMNVILEQTGNVKTGTQPCPSCGREMPFNWSVCPYCTIDARTDEVAGKLSQMQPNGEAKLCPKCNKMIHPSWFGCPYCLVKSRSQ